ncbi:MAG: T9SS type A sorting domain-containing protein, partial [Ignavibacteriales bacterium]|nr:T9SS type A sorting domain-containing protein [Ignavibacteriales bacterium]
INGILNATSSYFTSAYTWGGIVFNSGSSGNLNGCTINNVQTYGGAAISMFDNTTPTIQNCTISNNASATSGVYFYNTSSPYLYNNIIQGNSYYGLNFNHANAYLRHNTISATGNYAAVYCYNFATPLFAQPSGSWIGNNTMQSSYYGISANYYSTPSIGRPLPDATYNNRVVNNTTNAYAGSSSTIYAQQVYWNPSASQTNIIQDGGTVYYNNPIADPGLSIVPIDKYHINIHSVQSITDDEILQRAHELSLKGSYNNAISIYKSIINSKVNKRTAEIAVVELGNVFKANKDQTVLDFIKEFASAKADQFELRPVALSTLGHIYSAMGDFNSALSAFESLISLYPATVHEPAARLNMVYLYTSLGKYDLAKETLDLVKNKFPGDENILSADWYLKTFSNNSSQFVYNNSQQNTTGAKNQTPLDVQLYENYPNPFNPTTKISFSIPQKSQIKLKVFDVLGREVANLADGVYEVGKYEVTFDASKLPSGVYFYNLTTGSNSISKKMLLVK